MNKQSGCLILHGFGGSVHEIQPLAEVLKEDHRVLCPTLTGHTGRRQDLEGVRYQDWIHSAEEALVQLLTECERVYIIGFSMGGLIALILASRYPVQAVITLNSPIYYWDFSQIARNLLEDLQQKKTRHIRRYLRSGSHYTISALFHFRMLLSHAKSKLNHVTCPVLLTQSRQDDTVRQSSVCYLYEHISSEEKEVRYYPNSGHLILYSQDAADLIRDIRQYLKEKEER